MAFILLILAWMLALWLAWGAFRRGRLRTPWHLDVAAAGLLALVTLGFFWRVATGQNWMPADGGDLVSFLYPTYRFAADALRQGGWPLWNPFLYMGAPHVADIQAGFLYPPNLLLFLINPQFPYSALQWLSMGHLWFAGTGMYLFLSRGEGFRRPIAIASAVAFMFSDAFLIHFGNLNFNAVASWTPWVFWAYAAGLGSLQAQEPQTQRPERQAGRLLKRASIPGALLAVATLAGHIQATLFILLALAIYTFLRLWLERDRPEAGRRSLHVVAYGMIMLAVTVLLSAPVLLPALQLTGYTTRTEWSYGEAAGYSLSPAQWIGWVIPGFFGRTPQYHWGAWPRVEVGYLGILPLVLAGLGLALRRERRTWLWFGMAVASFLLASGIYAILHGWLTLVPGFGQLRAPARLALVTDFALATLAAAGLDAVLRPLDAWGRRSLDRVWRALAYATGVTWAFVVPLAYFGLMLAQDSDPAVVSRISIALIAIMIFSGLLLASLIWLTAVRGGWARMDTLVWTAAGLILIDLASNGAYQDLGNQDPSSKFQQSPIVSYLAGQPGHFRIDTRTDIDTIWQPDTAMLYGLEDIAGIANPLQLADTVRYWEGLGSRSTPLYDLLNVRYVIAPKDVDLDWNKFVLVFESDPELNVYENRSALPRAMLVPAVQVAADHEAAWEAIHAPDFDPSQVAVVEGRADAAVQGGQGSLSDIQSGPGYLALRATSDRAALVVVSQSWYPGWEVWIDGMPHGQPLRANYAFQGIQLPAGTHTVELRFTAPLWRLGWILAGLATLLLLVWWGAPALVRGWRRTNRARANGRPGLPEAQS